MLYNALAISKALNVYCRLWARRADVFARTTAYAYCFIDEREAVNNLYCFGRAFA